MEEGKKTPLYETHLALGGKMINFGGWLLPVEYSGIASEHQGVRERAGLFDVSHMGEISIQGEGALAFLEKLVTNDLGQLEENQALYGAMCYSHGGTVDDLLVYRLKEGYWLVVNGANIEKDYQWILEQKEGQVVVENISSQIAQLALQGPKALKILKKLTTYPVEEIKYYYFREKVEVAGVICLVSRTGYTGEDGFELYCSSENGAKLWQAILEAGKEEGILPAGLGARDTLRLEAGLPLYGHELGENISPLEAGLGKRFVRLDKGDFLGREALLGERKRKLVAIEMLDKGIPRSGYPIYSLEGEEIGFITSGTQSPTLKKSIAMGLIQGDDGKIGKELLVGIRNKRLKARIVSRPFYTREVK